MATHSAVQSVPSQQQLYKTHHEDPSSDSRYFKLFNSKNAKKISALVVFFILIYHGLVRLNYGNDTCIGLLEEGRYQGEHIWQPYGCMLHNYSETDSKRCMKYVRYWGRHNWIVFMGDERLRQLYYEFVTKFRQEKETSKEKQHRLFGLTYGESFKDTDLNLTVEYVWEPHVNNVMKDSLFHYAKLQNRPVLFVIGAALKTINLTKGSEAARAVYGVNVSHLLPYIQQMKATSTVVWFLQPQVVQSKFGFNLSFIRNDLLDKYNKEAQDVLSYSPAKLWHSARLLSAGYEDSVDGFLLGKVALNYDIQVLLNFYCNDKMNYRDGTCCSKPEPLTTTQTVVALIFLCCCVFTCCIAVSRCKFPNNLTTAVENGVLLSSDDSSVSVPVKTPVSNFATMVAFSKLFLIMLFFFACDRGNVFMKENKWFTYFNLFLPIAYLAVLGLFFTEETKKTSFMHRDQTDEWKGWMQLAILCYHITGARQVLWIYMSARYLISSYLFLLGYGHFMYFWSTGDFSLKRVFKVLFRYNLLAIVLCLTMNRPYQFYYYVPLISYWFLICYVTLALPPQITCSSVESNPFNYLLMVAKFIILFTLISILYLSEVFFEKIFVTRPWKALFVTSDDSIQKWWFRWRIDRYSSAGGMVLGFSVAVLRRYLILTDGQPCNLFSRRLSVLVACASIFGFAGYSFIMSQYCKTEMDCREFYAYISVVPIVSYVMLRNVFGCIRIRVSTFFAWFGRISLELFTAQYHIWLAADSNGVLVLFPRWPVFNVIITSLILVCVAHEVRLITLQLVPVFVPDNDPKIILRNVFLVLCICIPLGFLYGLL